LPVTNNRLQQQIDFILEIDKVKRVLRQTRLQDDLRQENDAEHSWHFATMALLLAEYAEGDIDVLRVVRMALMHDLVEIDAGDTFAYDVKGNEDKLDRERAAADRIFNLLPEDQAVDLRDLWEEFEEQESPESRYAAALDRLQPILMNFVSEGVTWKAHGITADRVIARNQHIEVGAPALWVYAENLIREAVERGYLERGTWEG
jgi:putative hydrolase of HD superfamily